MFASLLPTLAPLAPLAVFAIPGAMLAVCIGLVIRSAVYAFGPDSGRPHRGAF